MATVAPAAFSAPATVPELLKQGVPYLLRASSLALSFVSIVFQALKASLGKLVYPVILFSPIPIILYLLSPFVTFVQLALGVLVLAPYHSVVYLSDAIYPVYVFCGVACIVGALLGLSGRVLSALLIASAAGPRVGPARLGQYEQRP